MAKFIANPVEVDAFQIVDFSHGHDEGTKLWLEDGQTVFATREMMSRITLRIGDYWVVQADGYAYLNPKDVFERKYRPSDIFDKIYSTVHVSDVVYYGGEDISYALDLEGRLTPHQESSILSPEAPVVRSSELDDLTREVGGVSDPSGELSSQEVSEEAQTEEGAEAGE